MQNVTAYGALVDIADLQECETVLLLAASSSVRLAAIAMANSIGAIPIATTRTNEQQQALLDLGAKHVIVNNVNATEICTRQSQRQSS